MQRLTSRFNWGTNLQKNAKGKFFLGDTATSSRSYYNKDVTSNSLFRFVSAGNTTKVFRLSSSASTILSN